MKKASLDSFRRRLLVWYAAHGRCSLPWRLTRDPYAIYVSEIMLQQTQVTTVEARYYAPFLKRFPTLDALAKAKREDVLRAWQGLGYYNRAANLHEAAKQCSGTLPSDVDGLLSLPGIGRNTAHAVAAFAYGKPVAVMEANVKRVVSRIFALEKPSEQELWDNAEALLDKAQPFDYNQAMMDIGAMICTKRRPRCGECPAQAICLGKASPESYPAAKSKKQVPVRRKHIIVLKNNKGQFYAEPRQTRFLSGLYRFIEVDPSSRRRPGSTPTNRGNDEVIKKRLLQRCNIARDVAPDLRRDDNKLGSIRQQYSHFTLEAEIFLQQSKSTGNGWHNFTQLKALPMSMAEKKIVQLLEELHAH